MWYIIWFQALGHVYVYHNVWCTSINCALRLIACQGRLLLTLRGNAKEACSVPSFSPSATLLCHLCHSIIICFLSLTGLFCMMNAYHIVPVFIVSSSFLFCHLCVHTTVHILPLSGLYISKLLFHIQLKLLFHQQRSFLSPCWCVTSNLCVPTGYSRDEGWVDLSHCPYTQVQVWSLDHESYTPM